MDPYSYPLTRRLVRPVLIVAGCVAISAVGGLAMYGSRLWLAIPLGMVALIGAVMVLPIFFSVGDIPGEDIIDDWGWLLVMSALLVGMAGFYVPVAWYDRVAARPVPAVVTAVGDDGTGYQQVGLRAGGDDLGKIWVHDDRDLAVGDRVVVRVDRWGWARPNGEPEDRVLTAVGYGMGAVGLIGFVVLITIQVRADRRQFLGRERRRDGRTLVP